MFGKVFLNWQHSKEGKVRIRMLLVILGIISLPSWAETYKCESGGQVIYSDKPCGIGESKPIALKVESPNGQTQAAMTSEERVAFEKTQAEALEKERLKKEKAEEKKSRKKSPTPKKKKEKKAKAKAGKKKIRIKLTPKASAEKRSAAPGK
ncbi:MAG: DUF4124 domain-containing protein [Oxalobacter sp.]|nr:MAG: DUF4124 domain-containing protein [Oxalobacter sp.]